MRTTLYIILVFIVSSNVAFCQTEISFSDDQKYENIFSYAGSTMLDTSSSDFKLAKQNVLNYCNKRLKFKIDTIATWYSCRVYVERNSNNEPDENRFLDESKVNQEFYITFKVNNFINYHISFYLDSAFNVKSASETLFTIKKSNLWKIKPFAAFEKDVLAYENGYVFPIDRIELEYSEKRKKYVYSVIQDSSSETIVKKKTDVTVEYDLHQLIVDAETGAVLEETVLPVCHFSGF